MTSQVSRSHILLSIAAAAFFAAGSVHADIPSLNMGMNYRLGGVSNDNADYQDKTKDKLNYYNHVMRFYMTSWLNEDVEASLRVQSIDIWGLEGSGLPLNTHYPKADGTPWIEHAYIHMPNMMWNKLDLTLGRQSIVIGDGTLVSDDDLGFNAIRGQVNLPWKWEMDLFTAKVQEGLVGTKDKDLSGLVLGTDRGYKRWELGWIREVDKTGTVYALGTTTTTTTKILRQFYDIRLFGNLKDAYYKLEYAMQSGKVHRNGATILDLKGVGEKLELGAQTDTARYGRFGVKALYARGSGDDEGSYNADESFRPSFGKRWDGLQRSGYGKHFAGTLSDAYSPSDCFAPASTTNSGLPAGFSGIQTWGFGVFTTQRVQWTANLDYYTYTAQTKPTGKSDLGSEFDLDIIYRYTGFVTFHFGGSYFFPGDAYGTNVSRVMRLSTDARVHF
ncbi:MAG TPA: alginate export family protein [Elusimicrobiota bacterium]|nr:alginate export family protein [Elusimicrobiota bacterium]